MVNPVSDRKVTSPQAPVLPKAAPDPEDAKLRETAQEFEAIFLEKILSQMRAANRALSEQTPNMARETYEGWQDQEMAKSIARGGGIGLADALYRQLVQQQTIIRDR